MWLEWKSSAPFVLMAMSCIALTSCLDEDQQTSVDCDPKTQYLCGDGKKCIVKSYLCNGVVDCDDRDDETDCGKTSSLDFCSFSSISPQT